MTGNSAFIENRRRADAAAFAAVRAMGPAALAYVLKLRPDLAAALAKTDAA